jgi:phosphate transport system substrate-binding protein
MASMIRSNLPLTAALPDGPDRPDRLRRHLLLGGAAACAPGWAATAAAAASASPGQAVRVGGTGAGVDALAQLFDGGGQGGVSIEVVPSLGSSGGIKALLAGLLDVVVIARALKPDEEARGLRAVEVFRSPLVLAAASRTRTGPLKSSDLTAIYAGRFSVWGDGVAVRPVLRPEGDSDLDAVAAWKPDLAQAMLQALRRPGMRVAMTDDEAVENIEHIPGAIGTTILSLVLQRQGQLRALEIDGVAPSVRALAEGRWRPHKVFRLVTRTLAPDPGARLLQQLESPAAQARLTIHGHWPGRAR